MKPRRAERRYQKPPPLEKMRRRGINIARFRAESRRTLYAVLRTENHGCVPCFVCGQHVIEEDATLEHIIPLARGGKDTLGNYAISHTECNRQKGDKVIEHLCPPGLTHIANVRNIR